MPKVRSDTLALGAALLALAPLALSAQDAPKPGPQAGLKLGRVEGDVQSSSLTPALWHFVGHITITSDDYDLAAHDIRVHFKTGKGLTPGQATLINATAEGYPAGGVPVVVHLRRPLESQSYEIQADHAVYTPSPPPKPGEASSETGRMDFAGHVRVVTRSGLLAEPSVSTTDRATVLLGAGTDYPALSTGPAHIVLTPAQ